MLRIKEFTKTVAALLSIIASSAVAQPLLSPRSDGQVRFQGEISLDLDVAFVESVYLGANVLEAVCLLRFPSGDYGLAMEVVTTDSDLVDPGTFSFGSAMNDFDGSDLCQLRFGMMRIWLKQKTTGREGFVTLVPIGSGIGGSPVPSISDIQEIVCETSQVATTSLTCSFNIKNSEPSLSVAVPQSGVEVRNLNVLLGKSGL